MHLLQQLYLKRILENSKALYLDVIQMEKEQKREEKKRKDSAGHSSAESDREERGTYQSGYNNKSSEQYATKISQKPNPAAPQRPRRTQDVIKVSLLHLKTKHIKVQYRQVNLYVQEVITAWFSLN